jgi:hypothetical protein
MRTKTLLLTAALSAAGIATSMAQAVYSVNAVGYVNTTLVPGFNLISNPLNNTEPNGNQVQVLFASLPNNSAVYLWTGNGFTIASKDPDFGWDPADVASRTLMPGQGAFVNIPAGAGNQTVTFVGEVPQGTLSTPLPVGFSIVSSQVPQEGTAQELNYVPATGDALYFWTGNGYNAIGWDADFGEYTSPLPTLDVGEAFFVSRATAGSWNRTFSVNE